MGGVWVYDWRAHATPKRPKGMGRGRIWGVGREASASDAARSVFPQRECARAPETASAETRPEGAPQKKKTV